MGKSAFNKLAEQYIVTKNAVNKEVSRQLEVIVAETTYTRVYLNKVLLVQLIKSMSSLC